MISLLQKNNRKIVLKNDFINSLKKFSFLYSINKSINSPIETALNTLNKWLSFMKY